MAVQGINPVRTLPPSNVVANTVVDLRDLVPGAKDKPKPGETVLTKQQFQDLNKNLDLSGVPRSGGVWGPAFQLEGWSGAKGGFGASSPMYPEGAKGWEFVTNQPLKLGGALAIPARSNVSSGPTAGYPLKVFIPGKSGESYVGLSAGTITATRNGAAYDTGIHSTKIDVRGADGKTASAELRGTFFLDQKSGEIKLVRPGAKGEYRVQTLDNALKDYFKDSPIDQRQFADVLRSAGILR